MAALYSGTLSLDFLRALSDATSDPVVVDADLTTYYLPLAEVMDATGQFPGATGYVQTCSYRSLKVAAIEVLRQKMSRLATEFDVGAGSGVSFARSQKIAHIERTIAQLQASTLTAFTVTTASRV